jgi:hypothetical protein
MKNKVKADSKGKDKPLGVYVLASSGDTISCYTPKG